MMQKKIILYHGGMLEEGVYTKEETILRLKSHLLFDQVSFHTDLALQRLDFIESMLVDMATRVD